MMLLFFDLAFVDSRAPKAKDWIQESRGILKALKENLQIPIINRRYMQIGTGRAHF
jgi:hypothetical protein